MTNGSLMKVKSIAECFRLEHSAILLACIQRHSVLINNFGLFLSDCLRQVLLYLQIKKIRLSDVVFIMLIIVKMPTIVGILTFMSRINFVLS